MLIGEQGSAKTVMINAYLKKIKNEDHSYRTINFSSATATYQFQVTYWDSTSLHFYKSK